MDFALSTVGLPALARQQTRGPADHDLIAYDFGIDRDLRAVLRAPFRLPLVDSVEPVSSDSWRVSWAPRDSEFSSALQTGDLDLAWSLLSDAAETLLLDPVRSSGGTARRSQVLRPRPVALSSTKAPTVQSHKERCLPRLARRATELLRFPDSHDAPVLRRKLCVSASSLGLSFQGNLPRLVEDALSAAASLEASWWPSVLLVGIRLFSRTLSVCASGSGAFPLRILARLAVTRFTLWTSPAQEHDRWRRQWTREPAHSADETWHWCLAQGPPAAAWTQDDLYPTAEALLACMSASARRAPGLDGWAPSQLSRLPLDFYELLARLWAACLSEASLQRAWCQVRVALLHKPDGGRRPMAVASALWRVLATVVVRKLRSWTLSWVPADLLGSVPGRSCAEQVTPGPSCQN